MEMTPDINAKCLLEHSITIEEYIKQEVKRQVDEQICSRKLDEYNAHTHITGTKAYFATRSVGETSVKDFYGDKLDESDA